MEERSAKDVAKILAKFYEGEFYGKINSKYRIGKDQIKYIAGKELLRSAFMKEIKKELVNIGYIWLKLANDYIILKQGPLHRCRTIKENKIDELMRETKGKKTSPAKKAKKEAKSKK